MSSQQDQGSPTAPTDPSPGTQVSDQSRMTAEAIQRPPGAPDERPGAAAVLPFVGIIVAATIVAFSPTFRNDFVRWDDDVNLVGNENYRGLWPRNIRWMFSTTWQGPYQPLSWVSYAIDHLIWGVDEHGRPRAFGYHLTSLLLHAACAVVLFFIALRLLRLIFRVEEGEQTTALSIAAATGALLFAIHPLRVESVAWATERRDVLSGLFLLLATLTYLRARTPREESEGSRGRSLGATFVLFVAALLSKGTTLVFPIVLLVLDVYPLRRLSGGVRDWLKPPAREVWFEKFPFLAAAALAGVMAVRGQAEAGALLDLAERDIPARIAMVFYGPAFYLFKTVVPIPLSPLYEWPVDFSPLAWPYLLSAVFVVALTVLLVRFRSHWPAGLALWLIYLVFLLPVLVPFQAGGHLAADRYTYLSCIGWALLVAAIVAHCWLRRGGTAAVGVTAGVVLAVVALSALTFRQTLVWRDTWSLWTHVKQIDPECWHAYGGLGTELRRLKRHDDALEMLNKACQLNPNSAEIHNNLGSVYSDLGRYTDALPCYRKAIKLNPRLVAPRYNLAGALIRVDRLKEAEDSLRAALKLQDTFAQAHNRLGEVNVLLAKREEQRNDLAKARMYYERALISLKAAIPDYPQAADTARAVLDKLETMP